jgi:hypothetical protein
MKSRTSEKQAGESAKNPKSAKATPIVAANRNKKPDAKASQEKTPTSPDTAAVDTKKKSPKSAAAKKREKSGKVSALDAAAKVLGETGQPMTCQEMIDAMSKKGYWTSPGGRTPSATLYSAILRELKVKGAESRFKKTDRGKFARA